MKKDFFRTEEFKNHSKMSFFCYFCWFTLFYLSKTSLTLRFKVHHQTSISLLLYKMEIQNLQNLLLYKMEIMQGSDEMMHLSDPWEL